MKNETIGAKIQRLRGKRSLRDVAAAAGLSHNCLFKIEHDQSSPTVATVLKLATALGIKPQFFLKNLSNKS